LSSTAHFRPLNAALKSQLTNSIRFLPLVVLTNASSPRTFALLSICSSVSAPYVFIPSGLLWHFFHLDTLRCTLQFVMCIRCSELIYRYRNKSPCALLVRSRRWSWCTPFFGFPASCSVCDYEPLNFILLQRTQLIEKIRERPLFPAVSIHSQTSPPGLGILLPQRIPMRNANFHKLPKSFKVRASARRLAQRFQVLFHSCIPRSSFLPRIRYTRFPVESRCR